MWNGRSKVATRYIAVSLINTVNHQGLLYLANSIWEWTGGWANVFAAGLAAIPAYLLSRAWVWEVSGKHNWRTEVLPFWIIAFIGMGVSTLFAEVADRVVGAGIAVNLASLFGYFLVWVAKFFILDRLFLNDELRVGAEHLAQDRAETGTEPPSAGRTGS
jgi:putative flippase GtrA